MATRKAKRRIKNGNMSFVSLVPRGANRIAGIYKEAASTTLVLKTAEKGEFLAIVYAPNVVDSYGDVADKSAVRQMGSEFLSNGGHLDLRHNGKALPRSAAYIAETFIVQKSDERFHGWTDDDGEPVDLTGAWAVRVQIDDPELRKLFRSKKWNNVSMAGMAEVEPILRQPFADDTTMDEADIIKAVSKAVSPLTEAVTALANLAKQFIPEKPEQAAKATKADEPKKAPVYRGKPDDSKALAAFERELELHAVTEAADMTTAAGVRAFREVVKELKAGWTKEDAEATSAAKALAGSNTDPAPEAAASTSLAKQAEQGRDAMRKFLGTTK